MTHHVGFLYLGDAYGNPSEVINEYRTAQNLEGVGAWVGNVEEFAGCDGLAFAPCAMAADGTVTEWVPIPEADPWVGSGTPAATEALGFTIEEWTGIDGASNTRTVNPLANRPGGALFGRQSHRHRTMALNVLVHGTSERGLTYLFRWLETLLLATCSPCAKVSMWLREHCPAGETDADLEEGLLRAENVALLSGPEWVDPPIVELGCYVRRLSVTLAVGDPCLYRVPPAAADSDHSFVPASMPVGLSFPYSTAPLTQWVGNSVRATSAVDAVDIGLTSPVVTFTSPLALDGVDRMVLPTMRIFGLLDGPGLPFEARRVGLFTIHELPSGYEMVIDTASGAAQARDLHGDREWVNGGQFIGPNYNFDPGFDGSKSVTFGPCSGGTVVVEPALLELDWTRLATSWSVTIQAMTRSGCS